MIEHYDPYIEWCLVDASHAVMVGQILPLDPSAACTEPSQELDRLAAAIADGSGYPSVILPLAAAADRRARQPQSRMPGWKS